MKARGLRQRVTAYADPEFSLFLRKAFIKAAGYSDDALDRPVVAITNTASDFNPCHGNVPALIEAVKRGVLLSGALPMVFPTISLQESFSYPTSMLLRNLMAMDTEEMIRAQPMDSVVLIGGCDKTIPAQLMGAISADVPAIVLPVGPMVAGHHRGETLGACTDCRRLWAAYRAGDIDRGDIDAVTGRLAPSAGTCMVMGTASTMALVAETLGLTVPGSSSIPAVHGERIQAAEQTGKVAAALATAGGPTPSDILSPGSLRNAMAVLQAVGGSTNGVIHLAAIAGRAALDFDVEALDEIGRRVPVLVDVKPSGQHYMQHFHEAGGLARLLAELTDELDLTARTVDGGSLADRVMGREAMHAQSVIRPRSDPVASGGALAALKGNLCPRGALIKQSAASTHLLQHTGRAIVFDSIEDLTRRIDDPNLDVAETDVLVLRNAGPKGAPGMPEAGFLPIPRRLAARGTTDMIRISDARMSGTAFGTIVVHIAPEAAADGPLALVDDGDPIRLDVPARRLDLLVEEKELAARGAKRRARTPRAVRGYVKLYGDHVLQADEGCDFDFLRPIPPRS